MYLKRKTKAFTVKFLKNGIQQNSPETTCCAKTNKYKIIKKLTNFLLHFLVHFHYLLECYIKVYLGEIIHTNETLKSFCILCKVSFEVCETGKGLKD